MGKVTISPVLLTETFEGLRFCGDGRQECVAYWVAANAEPDVIRRVVHPVHISGPFGYEVDSDYVTQLFLELRKSDETVRVQVHTHPTVANHSRTDDRFALAPALGFLSLVIPNFGLGPVGLDESHLVEMEADGEWREVVPGAVIDLA